MAKARYPEVLLASLAGRAVEARPLKQAVEEGMEMVTRLSECVANATAAEGGYGIGGHEVWGVLLPRPSLRGGAVVGIVTVKDLIQRRKTFFVQWFTRRSRVA